MALIEQRPPFSVTGVRLNGDVLAFEQVAVRRFLPHRGRMLLVDRVGALSSNRREISAVKALPQNDPMFEGQGHGSAHFPQTLLIEALAQTCGFLMNVIQFLADNALSIADLIDPKLEGRLLRPPALSALAESKVRQSQLAHPGDVLALSAKVVATRGGVWSFVVRAETERLLAEGEIILAYPAYMTHAPSTRAQATARGGAGQK